MADYDDLNVNKIFLVGIASVVVTAVTALAVQVMYYNLVDWQQAETAAESNYERQNRILSGQRTEISSYGVDESTGNIVIPVEKAFDLMVGDGTPETEATTEEGSSEKT